MAAVCRALHVARATGYLRLRPRKGGFYRRTEDTEVLYEILSVTKTRASYGYRRTHRLVNREREASGQAPYNRKRIRRVMRIAGLQPSPVFGRIQHPLLERGGRPSRFRPGLPRPRSSRTRGPRPGSPRRGHPAPARRSPLVPIRRAHAYDSRLTLPSECSPQRSFVPSTLRLHVSRKSGGRADHPFLLTHCGLRLLL